MSLWPSFLPLRASEKAATAGVVAASGNKQDTENFLHLLSDGMMLRYVLPDRLGRQATFVPAGLQTADTKPARWCLGDREFCCVVFCSALFRQGVVKDWLRGLGGSRKWHPSQRPSKFKLASDRIRIHYGSLTSSARFPEEDRVWSCHRFENIGKFLKL